MTPMLPHILSISVDGSTPKVRSDPKVNVYVCNRSLWYIYTLRLTYILFLVHWSSYRNKKKVKIVSLVLYKKKKLLFFFQVLYIPDHHPIPTGYPLKVLPLGDESRSKNNSDRSGHLDRKVK